MTKRNAHFLKYSVLESLGQGQRPKVMLNIGNAPENSKDPIYIVLRSVTNIEHDPRSLTLTPGGSLGQNTFTMCTSF